ncbi:MAG: rhomboid family intramembrane serine protease [Sphingomonadales bacterium]
MLQHIPPGLRNLVILIALMGMAQIALPNAGFDPVQLYLFYPDSDAFRPWQLITHMFAHGGFTHFLFNVIALVSFGGIIEYKLGTRRFLTLYFLSGLGAALLHFISIGYEVYQLTGTLFPNHSGLTDNFTFGIQVGGSSVGYGPMLGASGAIYGLLVAFAWFYPREKLAIRWDIMGIFLIINFLRNIDQLVLDISPNDLLKVENLFALLLCILIIYLGYHLIQFLKSILFKLGIHLDEARFFVPLILLVDLIFGFTNLESDPFAHFAHLGGALTGFLVVKLWFGKMFRSNWP